MSVKRIAAVQIQNIKGIKNATFDFRDFYPNMPVLGVAPNGFGKSSFAVAFSSLNTKRLELDKNHYHAGDASLPTSLRVRCAMQDGSTLDLEANATKNEIAKEFDVFVVNSQLKVRAVAKKQGAFTSASGTIEVNTIVLINTIPPKIKPAYSTQAARASFGPSGKILQNIAELLANSEFLARLSGIEIVKYGGAAVSIALAEFKASANAVNGAVATILGALPDTISTLPVLAQISALFAELGIDFGGPLPAALAAMQVADTWSSNKEDFRKAIKRAQYEVDRAMLTEALAALKSTWKNVTPTEEKGKLVVSFPSAHEISNGERDILTFVGMLLQASRKLQASQSLLIVDEIFDYLDDANLLVCQYHLTQLISKFKQQERKLFVLILTHLQPGYFKNFTFANQKVEYFSRSPSSSDEVEKIIFARADETLEASLAPHYFHYSPVNADLTTEFATHGLALNLAHSENFRNYLFNQLDRYLENKSYDPISVCCAVRLKIEKKVYDQLTPPQHPEFLSTFKTTAKLDYGSQYIDIPELYYLLGVIYNEVAHLRRRQDNHSGLFSKLSNLTVQHMIKEACS